jgi:anaerobic selenocysteine-containing dehydrogenase
MKLDRRSFLVLSTGFSVGGAIGSTFSPLPWKMTDDIAIWTQNWPWTPVPEAGPVSFHETTCGLCPGGCGITLRKVGKKFVRVMGTKGHPVNDGGVCPLALSSLQLLYGPTRVKTPLKRSGKRGEGSWRAITWAEAIDEISTKLTQLRNTRQAHTAALYLGDNRGVVPRLFARLLDAFGSPNVIADETAWQAAAKALELMHGQAFYPGFDIANADFVVSFGANILEGWGSPVNAIRSFAKLREKEGKTFVCVDSKLSNTAAKAHKFVAVIPGSEAALALGMANVLISKGLADNNFLNWYAQGFEDVREGAGGLRRGFKRMVLEDYRPSLVAAMTGVPEAEIVALGEAFGKAQNPLALFGRGKANSWENVSSIMAIHALNAMRGRINQKGGVRAVQPDFDAGWPELVRDEAGLAGKNQPRIDGAGSAAFPLAQNLPNRLADGALNNTPYPLKALLCYGADPYYTLSDRSKVAKAFEHIEFIATFATHMNDTANMSDLVLPVDSFMEAAYDIPTPPGYPRPLVGLTRPVVPRLFDSKHPADIVLEIARKMGGAVGASLPWRNFESCLEASYYEGQRAAMKKDGYWIEKEETDGPLSHAFATRTRRFDFSPRVIAPHMRAPKVVEPGYLKEAISGDAGSFPLTLLPLTTLRLSTGPAGVPPFMVKILPNSVLADTARQAVVMNPHTARAYGVEKGLGVLSTAAGEAVVKVVADPGMPKNVIGMADGLGREGNDKYLSGKGASYRALEKPLADPLTGNNTAYGVRARIRPA